MSKMDRMLNSKKEKQTIYEIYRACRLCGAGAGYKMPIIQNVVDLDDNDVELKQKIRECVQIEVHQDDKMPPLICELCVDKVNDFYEFLEMCRQTNKRTRLRLGLPPQSLPGGAPDAGDCILGLTEPVYVNDDSDGEPLSKHRKPSRENKTNVLIKKEVTRGRGGRYSKKEPTPPRALRKNRNSREDASITTTQERTSRQSPKVSPKAAPKSILKKSEDTLISSRLKRTRDKDPVKLESPVKKVKIALKPVSPAAKSSARSGRKASPPCGLRCVVCDSRHKTAQALASHLRTHGVGYTSNNLACNPCGEWFPSARLAARHLRQHRARPCRCQRCGRSYATIHAYDQHITNDECLIWPHVPDVKCESCWNMFPTDNLLRLHRCLGEDHRPGGKCSKCNRNYALLKNLKKHESTCTAKRKKEPRVPGRVLAQLRPLQVRVARCDALLRGLARGRCDVSGVAADFGLDKNCIYPYKSSFSNLGIKSELDSFGGMVSINPDVKNEFCASEYVHWDSEESESDSDISLLPLTKKIDTLATLSLKIIFSNKCLGKVPRKRRRVKKEKVFEALDTEDDVTRDINNIINNLDKDDDLDAVDNLDNSGNDSIKTGSESKNNHTDKEFDFSNDFNDSKSLNDVNSHNNSLLVDNNGTINNSDGKIEENNTIVDKVKDSESSNKSDENSDGIENSVVHKDDDVGACLNSDENKCVTDDDDEKSKEISEQENDDCLTDKVDEENVNDETENAQINEEITKNDDDVNFEGKVDENDVLQDEINRDDDSQTNVM
ncbi:uncharacterized protein LOC113508910 isoform X3 [Trichoplusia ni]|uniref:Uncharacterized protein LOC113508910 isoform X3 n=1 Tax=Trichoplusia ni TaxID=7111 RepID=A0A7E5X5K3_TRINI|nr:uncharacterized protein LOC113508910 isoform X3 [Trichoplusia ni]